MKIYTWQELLVDEIAVRCPEEWMREQILDYALNVVGDSLWEDYEGDFHCFGEDSVFYIQKSSYSKMVKHGVELMMDGCDFVDDFILVDYEQSECYQMYNTPDINLANFEAMLLED